MKEIKIELKEIQKIEALERMQMLDIYRPTIKEFEKENIINKSEQGGILFWLNEYEQEMVKEFEEKHNAIVYHVIHNYTDIGEMYSLMYVSQNEDEWGYDKEDIQEERAFVYVVNKDEPHFSEFGTIGIKSMFGGVARVC